MRRALVAVAVLFAFPGAAQAQLPPIDLLSNTLLTSSGPQQVGETLKLTASVTSLALPVMSGTVDFQEVAGPVVCNDVPVVNGSAVCDVVPATAGPRAYLAQYSGTAGTLGSLSLPLSSIVARAPITVTAAPQSITYGQALPADLTATVTGSATDLLTGQKPACSIAGSPVNAGTYDDAITCTAGTLDVLNFLVTYVPADLTILRAPATVTANPVTMTAGEALPAVTATVSGLIGSDTLPVTCTGPATLPTEAGTYPGVLACVAEALNYAITTVSGTLTVLASTLPGAGGPGASTTNNTTNNVTNVGIVGAGGTKALPKAPTLSLLTRKVKRGRKARLKLSSSGTLGVLKLVLKRDGKAVARGKLAVLSGAGSATLKAPKKLRKGVYTLEATWFDGLGRAGKKRFNVRVR